MTIPMPLLLSSAERMMKMAEVAQTSQIETVRRAQDFTQADIRRSHWMGLTAILVAIGGGIVFVKLGAPWVAGLCLSMPVMATIKALYESTKKIQQLSPDQQSPQQ